MFLFFQAEPFRPGEREEMPSREGFPLEQGSSLPPPSQPETGHHGALVKVALCLQYNVAEGSGADTTGNLPVSEEASSAAEVAGCLDADGGAFSSCRAVFPSLLRGLLKGC